MKINTAYDKEVLVGSESINILVTLDSNYIKPLKVMLKSLFMNNQGEIFTIYMAHSIITDSEIRDLEKYISKHGHKLVSIKVGDKLFDKAPAFLYYPKEMYYRLLAHNYLPDELDRILYLDPDILVLNSVRKLYETNLRGYLYAAVFRENIPLTAFSKIRFRPYKIEAYYNSGVLLMNLKLHRKLIKEEQIFGFIKNNRSKLLLPDQDLINLLYAKKIKSVKETLYNFDTRLYGYYKLISSGEVDMDYVINKTVFMHFCGSKKPWKKNYYGRFHALYKHYEKVAEKIS
jgi:lipopolysaccharide biosynthesis glycosyltransferase